MANRRRLNARSSNSLPGHRRSDHRLHSPPHTCCYRCNQSSVTFNHTGILIRLQMVLSVNAFAPGPRSPPQEREILCTPARAERDLFCICLWLMFSYIAPRAREKEMAHHDVFPVFTPYTYSHSHWRDRCFSIFVAGSPGGGMDLILFSFQTQRSGNAADLCRCLIIYLYFASLLV